MKVEEPLQSEGPTTPGMGVGSAHSFFLLLLACGLVLLCASWWWGGIDFAGAELLGFLVVALNFYWTKRAVKSVLFNHQPKSLLTASYLVKVALTAFALFYGIVNIRIDPLGVLVGLSSLLLASLIFAAFIGWQKHRSG